jgi:hypothetical protein
MQFHPVHGLTVFIKPEISEAICGGAGVTFSLESHIEAPTVR